jgi:hypothetical protein
LFKVKIVLIKDAEGTAVVANGRSLDRPPHSTVALHQQTPQATWTDTNPKSRLASKALPAVVTELLRN